MNDLSKAQNGWAPLRKGYQPEKGTGGTNPPPGDKGSKPVSPPPESKPPAPEKK